MNRLTAFLTALLILIAAPVMAQEDATVAKQAIIVDFDTGTVLLEKNADERMPTSSMSKTMTIYMVFEALKEGRLSLDQTLPVSEKAWKTQGSKMFVHVGDQVKVEDLIRGVVVQSGNDAAIVLAEGVTGSEMAFADAMNQRMNDLGMSASHFVNASGWPDPEHYSTARDLAILGVRLIRDHPEHYKYYSELEYTYNNIKQGNRNPLLYRNIGADGIKTGHTEDAGYGLMASGTMGGRRVVMVLNGMTSMQERADESARLLEWALRNFENVNVFKPGDVIENVPVVLGQAEQVPLTIEQNVIITLPTAVRRDLKVEAVYNTPLKAPIEKGQKVGLLKVSAPRVSTIEVPLRTAEAVPQLGFFGRAMGNLKLLLSGAPAAAPPQASTVTETAPAAVTPQPAIEQPPQPAPVVDMTPRPTPEAGPEPATETVTEQPAAEPVPEAEEQPE